MQPSDKNGQNSKHQVKVRITKIDRNLPDEKRLEIQTPEGEIGYFECRYDPRSEVTTSTIYYNGEAWGSVSNPEKGNHIAIAMQAAFNKMPPLDKALAVPV